MIPFQINAWQILQYIADNSGKNTPTLRKYKVLVGLMFKYAVIHDIITPDMNKTQYIDIKKAGNPNAYNREPFSKKEIDTVWKCILQTFTLT